jgi:hypothetical protein
MFSYASHDNNYFAKPPACRLLCIGNCISNISSRSYVLPEKLVILMQSDIVLVPDSCSEPGVPIVGC